MECTFVKMQSEIEYAGGRVQNTNDNTFCKYSDECR